MKHTVTLNEAEDLFRAPGDVYTRFRELIRKEKEMGQVTGQKFKAPPQQAPREIYARMPFVSTRDHTVQYKSTIYTDGSAHCTCEGFRYREDCKHIGILRQPATVVRF